MRAFWYETQERAFAPSIAEGWPKVIAAPHTKNGRLVRHDGDPSELLAALRVAEDYLDATLSPCDVGCECVIHIVRAAIAKAEGK